MIQMRTDGMPRGRAVDDAGWMFYGEPVRGRSCGSCSACCTLVPADLPEGHKDSGVRCPHLCSKGCRIYAQRPTPCRYWSCRFLFDPEATALRRPDVSGYVVDPMLDSILSNGQARDVLQVWLHPARTDAHRAPELRAYLAALCARHGLAVICRWNAPERRAVVLLPPSLTDDGTWWELPVNLSETKEEFREKLADVGAMDPEQRLEQARAAERAG